MTVVILTVIAAVVHVIAVTSESDVIIYIIITHIIVIIVVVNIIIIIRIIHIIRIVHIIVSIHCGGGYFGWRLRLQSAVIEAACAVTVAVLVHLQKTEKVMRIYTFKNRNEKKIIIFFLNCRKRNEN